MWGRSIVGGPGWRTDKMSWNGILIPKPDRRAHKRNLRELSDVEIMRIIRQVIGQQARLVIIHRFEELAIEDEFTEAI
jgi:hypothetical protein